VREVADEFDIATAPTAVPPRCEMKVPKELAFSKEEYKLRIGKVRESLERGDFDGILLLAPHSVYYLTGMDSEDFWDFQCLVMTRDGRLRFVTRSLELGRFLNSSWLEDVATYTLFDDPYDAVASVSVQLGVDKGRLALEISDGFLNPQVYAQLRSKLPLARIEDSRGLVECIRLVKSEAELNYMRQAAALTDLGVRAAYETIRPGVRDCEVAAQIMRAMYMEGSDTVCWGPIVAAGYRAGLAHSTFCGYRIKNDDTVLMEFTGERRRYVAPLMRTVILNKPRGVLLDVARAASAAIEAILDVAKPGVPASQVAKAGASEISPVRENVVFHDDYGYPVGIGYPPSWPENLGFYIRSNNDRPLEKGMVFHLPMSLRKLGEWGIGLSETIVITEGAAQVLSNTAHEMKVIS
jgi:Xaa-Pro dipeptidase